MPQDHSSLPCAVLHLADYAGSDLSNHDRSPLGAYLVTEELADMELWHPHVCYRCFYQNEALLFCLLKKCYQIGSKKLVFIARMSAVFEFISWFIEYQRSMKNVG